MNNILLKTSMPLSKPSGERYEIIYYFARRKLVSFEDAKLIAKKKGGRIPTASEIRVDIALRQGFDSYQETEFTSGGNHDNRPV
jgi:hypothetical protein